jgi:epoxyqueuosine reductase QueG
MSLNQEFLSALEQEGCTIAGFADLSGLRGIAGAPVWPKYVTTGIIMGATYAAGHTSDNLERFTNAAVQFLKGKGYKTNTTVKPPKMLGTLSGIGWIGRCAMLTTETTGPGLRLATVLTDAPFECGTPVTKSKCPPDCTACADACPAGAISDGLWEQGDLTHGAYWDESRCRDGRTKMACHARCITACRFNTVKDFKVIKGE